MKTPLLDLGSYPQYGFDILEVVLLTGNVQTRRYKVFWHCCRQYGEATQRALTKRMKAEALVPCVTCTRKQNGRSLFYGDTPSLERDLFAPNLRAKPAFKHGVVSAALAWPVPQLVRASL
jgi:hypothetical protein